MIEGNLCFFFFAVLFPSGSNECNSILVSGVQVNKVKCVKLLVLLPRSSQKPSWCENVFGSG